MSFLRRRRPKNKHFSSVSKRLRRRRGGGHGGGSGNDGGDCHSDASSSAPSLAYLYDDPPSPSTPGRDDCAVEEAEAAVMRGERRGDDDNWHDASAAAAASVAALAEAVRRGSEERGGEVASRTVRELVSPPCSPRSVVDEAADQETVLEMPPPPSAEEEDGSEGGRELQAGEDCLALPVLTTTPQEVCSSQTSSDAPATIEEDRTSLNGRRHEEEKKEEEDYPPPPLLPHASMTSPQRRKYAAAYLRGGGVTFADDHSSVSAPLEAVRKVPRLPKDCYGGSSRSQRRGTKASSRQLDDVNKSEGDASASLVNVLLLCPSTKQFELVRVSLSSSSKDRENNGASATFSLLTCGEVLSHARRMATFRPVRKQRYTGLCQMPAPPASLEGGGKGISSAGTEKSKEPPREMINALRIDSYGIGEVSDGGSNACDGGVLVAIPKGLTASKAAELADPIISNETMRRLMRERLSPRKKRRRHMAGPRSVSSENEGSQTPIGHASRIGMVLKVVLFAAVALGILSAMTYALFPMEVQRSLEATATWMCVRVPPLAPTPGYRDDNAGMLEECCQQNGEVAMDDFAGGDDLFPFWFSWYGRK